MILSVKHSSASKNPKQYIGSTFHVASTFGTKRQRVASTAPYDRLVICADIAEPGKVFALTFGYSNEGRRFFFYLQTIGVGTIIYIGDPKHTNDKLGQSGIPIVRNKWPCVPISLLPVQATIENMIPECPLSIPPGSGGYKYFVRHHISIRVHDFVLCMQDVSCSGRFCDRAHPLLPGVSCGCYTKGLTADAIVGEMTVVLLIDPPVGLAPEGHNNEGVAQDVGIIVPDFRSLRTTEVFFVNLADYAKQDKAIVERATTANRRAVSHMVTYVNDHGGWSTVGWFKKGEVQDASSEDTKIDSGTVQLHLSLLLPSDMNILFGAEQGFKALRIRRSI